MTDGPEPVRAVYALYPFVRPIGSQPLPSILDDVEELFAAAAAAYEAGRYREAQEGFLWAAAALGDEPDRHYAEALLTTRVLAYRNAALASAMAGTSIDALDLATLAARDPRAAAELQEWARRLGLRRDRPSGA